MPKSRVVIARGKSVTKRSKLRSALILVVALLVVGPLAWAFLPASYEVNYAEVSFGPVAETATAEAQVRARDRFKLVLPASSALSELPPPRGSEVGPGQVVLRLVPQPMTELEAEQFRLRMRGVETRAADTGQEAARLKGETERMRREELRAEEMIGATPDGPAKLEQAKLALARSLAAARSADYLAAGAAAEYELYKAIIKYFEKPAGTADVLAPVEGVLTRTVDANMLRKAEGVIKTGTPVLEISDLRGLEVVAALPSADAVKVKPGTRMLLEQWGGASTLQVAVRELEQAAHTGMTPNGVQESRVNVLADLVGAPGTIADGSRMEARFVIGEKANAFKVPAAALVKNGSAVGVFTVVGSRARYAGVTTGLRGQADVEILSGLEPRSRVILNPPPDLKDGSRIHAQASP